MWFRFLHFQRLSAVENGGTCSASPLPLRLQAQGWPSMTNPFAGSTVHWTVLFIRLTPVPREALNKAEILMFSTEMLLFRFSLDHPAIQKSIVRASAGKGATSCVSISRCR
jgi:hypothetical protein